jgi:hypothetical protein
MRLANVHLLDRGSLGLFGPTLRYIALLDCAFLYPPGDQRGKILPGKQHH